MMHSGDITVGNLTSFLLYTAYVGVSIVGIGTAFSDIMKVCVSLFTWMLTHVYMFRFCLEYVFELFFFLSSVHYICKGCWCKQPIV